MEKITWNNLAKAIHENAVAHGWWEEDRGIGEICALIHSELSEALEEYRNGRRNVYYNCINSEPCALCNCEFWDDYNGECIKHKLEEKPEGIAVELVDAVIRILDYTARREWDIEKTMDNFLYSIAEEVIKGISFPHLIAECHHCIAEAYDALKIDHEEYEGFAKYNFARCILLICKWCGINNLNIADILILKHEYNKTRPYKHGGKKC